jgi:hypothetical protein
MIRRLHPLVPLLGGVGAWEAEITMLSKNNAPLRASEFVDNEKTRTKWSDSFVASGRRLPPKPGEIASQERRRRGSYGCKKKPGGALVEQWIRPAARRSRIRQRILVSLFID